MNTLQPRFGSTQINHKDRKDFHERGVSTWTPAKLLVLISGGGGLV